MAGPTFAPTQPPEARCTTSMGGLRLVYYALLYAFSSNAHSLVNRTIDDEYGDSTTGVLPVYLPQGCWTQGLECTECRIYPPSASQTHLTTGGAPVDPFLIYNHTWHDNTQYPDDPQRNITVDFMGQAVYVFTILANVMPSATTQASLTFTLDGAVAGQCNHNPDPQGPTFMYNVPVYTKSTLAHRPHTLVISPIRSGNPSLVLYDYVLYTTIDDPGPGVETTNAPDSTPTTQVNSGSPTTSVASSVAPTHLDGSRKSTRSVGGRAVGGIVGGLVAMFFIVALALLMHKYGRPAQKALLRRRLASTPVTHGRGHQ